METTRRAFLRWLGATAAFMGLSGHHKPGHNKGPKPEPSPSPTASPRAARVTWSEFQVPLSQGSGWNADILTNRYS